MEDSGGKKALLVGNDGMKFVVTPAVNLFKISDFLGVSIVKSFLLSDETTLL